ncbi:GNAT family N-acetyltransferase [Pleomorphomonas sp. JP5]|uniref:GNAT family N-acetyltransferase n=1 Tax=Pleomorphomonas sp. JP5 TaxID=2942998 RepID=UPI002043D39A|nr:GNAT family N-acetyltransferase [Pleomorphomonas sp. JP5]MCM5556111.1 GNAT family N-acetyltransferase [Pleomorphomonas sp. JP5]
MISIRAASERDADDLPDVERSSGAIFREWPGLEWIAEDTVQSADQHRALIAQGVALVAEDEEAGAVGFLNGELTSDGLHIWQIAVHRDWQGQGIGRRLIAAGRQIAEERGAKALLLTTFRDVPWNEPYYQRLGFHTLAEGAITPRLLKVLENEGKAGIPVELRCAMVMPL